MRVLHVAAGNLYGGVERILEELARHGAPGHEFALSFSGRVSAALAGSGAAVHTLGPVRFSRPVSVWRARRRLKRLLAAATYDAVVGHSPWAYAIAAPVARRSGVRRVLWAHDALRGDHWTERRVMRHAPDRAICNSRYTADALASWLGQVRRDVVYAPVSAPSLDPSSRAVVRRELDASDTTAVILMASRMERWKGHAELIRASAALRGDCTIWIAGAAQRPHEMEYERELRTLAASLPIRDRVVFLGERRDVGRLFQAADLHCQPNTSPEPFGIAFIEALYAGVPVVTSDVGGAQEIVTPECGILVPPGDRAALSQALQGLVDDASRRSVLGSAGPARARALCDPAAQVAALERAIA